MRGRSRKLGCNQIKYDIKLGFNTEEGRMKQLIDAQFFILNDFKEQAFYNRLHYQSIRLANRINGIVGARGTGKTTFLLKTAIDKGAYEGNALYVSADSLFFLDNKIYELCEWIYKETEINYLCIDEIHKYKNWNQELKNIYDTFSGITVLFSGSSMIDILHSKYDLSRRVSLYPMHGFSFREYLEHYLNVEIEPIDLAALTKNHVKISHSLKIPKILKHFREYLKTGYYPFTKNFPHELDRFQGIENIIQKTIYEDISVLHNIKTPSLLIIEKIFKYILGSCAGELNVNKLANRVQRDFNDVNKYLSYLDQAGLITLLYNKKSGKALLGTPTKILPNNSNMIYAFRLALSDDNLIGKVRETFAVSQLKNAGLSVYCSESGDYISDQYTFEIGGKNKSLKQIKDKNNAYVLADDILVGDKSTIPLYLLGFLY